MVRWRGDEVVRWSGGEVVTTWISRIQVSAYLFNESIACVCTIELLNRGPLTLHSHVL